MSQFRTLGHPGRYYEVYEYNSGQVDFTGSMYGYGAIMVKSHGGATASLSGGGKIRVDELAIGLHELSVSKITGGTSSVIYVLKRQQ
jgi:hypothetical protein